MNARPKPEKRYWLDDPRNVRKVYRGLITVCGLLLIADAFYHKHVELAVEGLFGFYSLFGFVACIGLVLTAKELRKILMRDETFYDE